MDVGTPSDGRERGNRVPRRDDAPLGVAVVFSELVEAAEPVTEAELRERTLLPERTVADALGDLEGTDAVHVLSPRTDDQPPRYFLRGD